MSHAPVVNPHTTLVALLSVAHTAEQAEHAAKTVLDLHARYLADQIRRHAQTRHDRDFSDNRIFRLAGAQAAANDIDPEAQP